MLEEVIRLQASGSVEALRHVLRRLALDASVEMNVQDLAHLDDSRNYLPSGARIYISHLPKQAFTDTLRVCALVRAAGFDPIPHVPVRLIGSHGALSDLVGKFAACAVKELLLIAGDYAHAAGPFSNVLDVLQSIDLRSHGIERVSYGGHPEGHSTVALEQIRRAEVDKDRLARDQGLPSTFVTQFFFEAAPFFQWVRTLRSAGVSADIRAGLAGPAKLTTLLRFAMRCGVGPSVKALGSKPNAFAKLLGEHGPEELLGQLAETAADRPESFQGIHMFCFGGYLRTCRWLHSLASGEFRLDAAGRLTVH